MWPHFVLGAADPLAPWALRLYAVLAMAAAAIAGWDRQYARDVWRLASGFDCYRRDPAHRKGDPSAPRHRSDAPWVIHLMRGTRGA